MKVAAAKAGRTPADNNGNIEDDARVDPMYDAHLSIYTITQ